MIRRIVGWLASHGIHDIVMNLHHRPETLTAVVGDGRDLGVRVRYSWEQPRVLGSAGGPRHALPLLDADGFLIVNGDTLTDVDVTALVDAHHASAADVTMTLVPNVEYERYGGVLLDDQDRVTGFVPRGSHSEASWHFVGVQVAQAAVFSTVPPGTPANSVTGVYDRLIRERPGSVRGFRCNAAFHDVGTTADYVRTSQAFTNAGGVDAGRRVRIDASARVTRSILWDDVAIDADAVVEDCIVTDGVEVPAGTVFRHAILIRRDDSIVTVPLDASAGATEHHV